MRSIPGGGGGGRALSAILLIACGDPPATDAGVDAFAPVPSDAGTRPTVVAEETADVAALTLLADLAALPSLDLERRLVQQSSEDRLLGGPVSTVLLENGNRDMNHFVCLGEGSDFQGPNLVLERFDMEVCPEPYVRGAVMSRFEGSGALVRLWMTLLTIKDRPPDRERLLIYVDDETEPIIDVPLAAVLDGSASEIFAPPFGAAAQSHVAWYYPVVFGSRLIVSLDGAGPLDLIYHQSTVAIDETPRARIRSSAALPERAIAALALVDLARGASDEVGSVRLAPSDVRDVLTLTGAGTVRSLTTRAGTLSDLAGVRLRVYWDGGAEAAIDVPLLELFASSFEAPPLAGPLLGAEGASVTLRLPMPFSMGARFEVENTGAAMVSVELEATLDRDAPAAGRLHVERNETLGPTTDTHHPLVDVTGAGRLAGVCLLMEGHALPDAGAFTSNLNFLEGDERITVDGEVSITGTGTEDYLDGAFYFERGPHATPWTQAWVSPAVGDTGRVTGCRWHVRTQAIDFATSLTAELEIGPGVPAVLDRYRSVAFLYR